MSTDCDMGSTRPDVSDFKTASTTRDDVSVAVSDHRQNNLRVFTLTELKAATNNFRPPSLLGEGGFGCVYRGVIQNTEDPHENVVDVAVKQLDERSWQGQDEWLTEVKFLGVVDHLNLVKLVGYCAEDDERRSRQLLLIYEYMPNGSVRDHLSSRFQTILPWETRLKIAQDAARGLAYLHEGMNSEIIFRDFKSSNILLDEQWNAKLSDFGLARLGPSDGRTHVTTRVVGTFGYAAPEYLQTGHLTSKSDVWSYGVFLCELITGRTPFDGSRPKNEQNLVEWVKPHLNDAKFALILDPKLEWNGSPTSAIKLGSVAKSCLERHRNSRPKMSEVLEMVNQILEPTQTAAPSSESSETPAGRTPIRRFMGLFKGVKGCFGWRTC